MLQKPHSRYHHLYAYYLDRADIELKPDPDLIGIWIEDECAILFFHQPREACVRDICRQQGARIIYQADLEYRDWEAGVDITSFATSYLSVSPVWERQQAVTRGRQPVILDPSVIFGSGFHATTRLCLEVLEMLMRESGERIESVLDLGTGTGLLAIAAAKLGAVRVVGIDNNPLAISVAQRNVELNGCEGRVEILRHDLHQSLPAMDYDLVITNLYKGLLIRLFEHSLFWKPRFHLVSGFIPGMEADLLAALPKGLGMPVRRSRDQWRLWLLEGKHTTGSGTLLPSRPDTGREEVKGMPG